MNRRRLAAIALLLVTAAALLHVLRGQRVTIELDTRTLFLYDENGIHPLPPGSLVIVNAYMPYPGGLLRAAGAVEAPGRLSLSIPAGEAVEAWLRSGLPRRGRYPLLTVLVIAYTPQGEYIGGAALDPFKALLTLHAREYNNSKKLDEAYRLLDENPVKILEEAYSGTLSLAGTVLYKADIGGNIDYAVEKAEEIAHVEHRKIVVHGALPDGTPYTARVYNPVLYSLRGKPPKAWYQRVLVDGEPAPRQLVEELWHAYATHFSMEYIFPANTSLSKILTYAYAARDVDHIYLVRTMTEFLRDLEAARNGREASIEWRDITPSLPEMNVTVPLVCAVVRAYGISGKGSEPAYVIGTLEYSDTGTGFAATGIAIEGLEALGESILHKAVSVVVDAVSGHVPVACIEAPGTVKPGYAPGRGPDIVVTLVDVRQTNGQWVAKPFAVLLPSLRLETSYNHVHVYRQRGLRPQPAIWPSFLWHSVLRDAHVTVYNGTIEPAKPEAPLSCSLAVYGAGGSYSGFSCILLDYFFPYLARFMHTMGVVGKEPANVSEIVEEARRGGYPALALEESTVVASSIHTSLTAMSEGLDAGIYVDFQGNSSAHLVVEEDSVPGVEGLHVLLGRYWVTAYAGGDPLRGGRGGRG